MEDLTIADHQVSIDHEEGTTVAHHGMITDGLHLPHPREAADLTGATTATCPLPQAKVAIHYPCRHATDPTAETGEETNLLPATHTYPATKAASAPVDPANQTTANRDVDRAIQATHETGTQTSVAPSVTTDAPATREASHETEETGAHDRVVRIAGTSETTGAATTTSTGGGRTAFRRLLFFIIIAEKDCSFFLRVHLRYGAASS